MLNIMRSHARSWLIKVIFAVIILVFIFFFGYSRMRRGGEGPGIAARVNGEVVPYGRYKMALDEVREFYGRMFNEKIPENMWPEISRSALIKVISEELLVQISDKLGVSVTPEELYDMIHKTPSFQRDGQFDPIAYKTVILPYFERRYGINYEGVLRKELIAAKVVDFLTEHVTVSGAEAKVDYEQANTVWDLDRIRVDNEDIAKEVLEASNSGSEKKLANALKKQGLEKEALKGITIKSRHRLIPSDPDNEAIGQILSLTKSGQILSSPVRSGSALYIFRLTGVKKPSGEEWEKEKGEFIKNLTNRRRQDYLREWQENLMAGAKIEEYVISEKAQKRGQKKRGQTEQNIQTQDVQTE